MRNLMIRWFRFIHKPTLICCCIVLFSSMYPGSLVGLFESFSLIVISFFGFYPFNWLLLLIPIVLVWRMIHIRSHHRDHRSKVRSAAAMQRSIFTTVGVMLLTLYLVVLKLPFLLGFVISRPYFTGYLNRVAQAPATELTDAERQLADWRRLPKAGRLRLDERFLGLYGVREIGIDAQGGTYFVIDTQGLISTQTHYGIAHRPQRKTPFGSGNYRSRRIMGDWYEFAVVDEQSGR